MKKITMMYLNCCPYCNNAKKILDEVLKDHDVEVIYAEENHEKELADSLDYYYVPSFFDGTKKLYEASKSDSYDIMKDKIVRMLNEL